MTADTDVLASQNLLERMHGAHACAVQFGRVDASGVLARDIAGPAPSHQHKLHKPRTQPAAMRAAAAACMCGEVVGGSVSVERQGEVDAEFVSVCCEVE